MPKQKTSEAEILALLRPEKDGMSTGAVAAVYGCTTQAVLYHLKRLEGEGLVRRVGSGPKTRWEVV